MKVLISLSSLLVFSLPCLASDCGAIRNREEIDRTRLLVVYAAPVRKTIGEFPTPYGKRECVRFVFMISPWGNPFNINILETSNNTAFEMAAFDALSKYKFKSQPLGFLHHYSLIISGIDNKLN